MAWMSGSVLFLRRVSERLFLQINVWSASLCSVFTRFTVFFFCFCFSSSKCFRVCDWCTVMSLYYNKDVLDSTYLLRPSASSKRQVILRWASWRHTGSGQRDVCVVCSLQVARKLRLLTSRSEKCARLVSDSPMWWCWCNRKRRILFVLMSDISFHPPRM